MRQIQVGACSLVIFAAVAACSGASFSSSEGSGSTNGGPTLAAGGSTGNRGPSSSGAHDIISSEDGGEQADSAPPLLSGGSASGGGSGAASAGSSASGGNSASGGVPSPSECATGSVKFKMEPGADLPHDYLCDAGCGSGWLTITDAVGATAFSLFSACGVASCETCEVQACVASACLPKPLTGEGSELTWTGSFFTKDTCGEDMACQRPACVKPGKYKAKACAALNAGANASGGCMPKDAVLCAEAEFEFPGTETVKLVLKK
jgi:hypothetical protein